MLQPAKPVRGVDWQDSDGPPHRAFKASMHWLRNYRQQVLALLWKDLLVELRSRDVAASMLIFGILSLTIFTFAFDLRGQSATLLTPGILWVSILFAGMLGLGRSFGHEKERGSLEGVLLCPMDRSAIFLSKFLTNLFLLVMVEAVLVPIFASFFDVPVLRPATITVILLGTVGFSAVGTIFGAMAVNTRAREVMLPVLMLPVLVPLVIAAVKATGLLMDGEPWSETWTWISILLGFDLVYVVVSFVMFEFAIEDWG